MARGSHTLVPPGTVRVFDRHEQLRELTDEQRARLRAVVVSHDNDPIAVLGPDLLVQRPPWLADGQRGRGVPQTMRWQPLGTFIQTGMDAMNAMLLTPGEFASFGHDYRADMAAFVRDAYGLPEASDEQLDRIEQVLRSLEFERHQRIKAERAHAAPPAPAARAGRAGRDNLAGGVPLRSRRAPATPWLPGRASRADRERGRP